MGLRSPFGNGPDNIQSPVPGVTAGAAPNPQVPPSRAPSAAPSTQPSAPAQPQNDYMDANSYNEYSDPKAYSGDDLVVGSGDSPVHHFMQQHFGAIREKDGGKEIRVGDSWKKLSEVEWNTLKGIGSGLAEASRMAGMVGGEAAGAGAGAAAGGPVGAVTGAVAGGGVGYDIGDQAVNMTKKILGIKDPEMRADLLGHMQNMMTGMMGVTGGKVASSMVAGKLAADASQMAVKSATPDLVAQGTEAAGQLAAGKQAASDATGVPLTKDQVAGQPSPTFNNPNEAAQFQAARDAQKAKTVQVMDGLTDKMGEGLTADEKTNRSGLTIFKGEIDKLNSKIDPLIKRAQEAAGDRQFSVEAPLTAMRTELQRYGVKFNQSGSIESAGHASTEPGLGIMLQKYTQMFEKTKASAGAFSEQNLLSSRDIPFKEEGQANTAPAEFSASGRGGSLGPVSSGDINMDKTPAVTAEPLNPNASQLGPNPAGGASRGVTLKDIDAFTRDAQEFANFQKDDRSSVEKSWGKVQRAFADVRDDSASSALQERGQIGEAHQLRGARAEYNERIDGLNDVVHELRKDPTNIGQALFPLDDPAKCTKNWQVISRSGLDVQKLARGGVLDSLVNPSIDRSSNTVGASAIEARLKAADPKSLRIIFGDEGLSQIKQAVNLAKIMENTKTEIKQPSDSPAFKKLVGIIMNKGRAWTEGKDFISNLLANQPKAREWIDNNASGYMTDKTQVSKLQDPTMQKALKMGGMATGAAFGNQLGSQVRPILGQ